MSSPRHARHTPLCARRLLAAWSLAALAGFSGTPDTRANATDLVKLHTDGSDLVTLAGQRPAWAKASNDRGAVADDLRLNRMTLVLKRSVERQRAFDALLRAQQDPSSPDYHQWLSPDEVGARFGASSHDIDAVTEWLATQGLRVDAVSESRLRIHFSGNAMAAAKAFGTRLHHFLVAGEKRIAAADAVRIPAELADTVASVIGLESIQLRPLHRGTEVRSANRQAGDLQPAGSNCQGSVCNYAVFPADFAKIYNLDGPYAQGIDGSGQSIAIVSRARVSDEDMRNFQELAELPAKMPTTIIPPGGIDPGPAAATCSETGEPSCDDPSEAVSNQMEATLDVQRAGSAAPGATIKLIASASDDTSEGIFTALEYAIDTNPPPARVISISYGTCEADNSADAAAYLDDLYGQAAMQGISVFVASGDSGAGDCASHLEPPDGDQRLSTNILCTSEHVTCVGGTEFSDEQDPDAYWTRTNSAGFLSARGYIPEGAWNESLRYAEFQLAASGGGISQYIATPAWQTGAGIPEERTGRYVPDVSLGASSRTGYFTCMAAIGGSCTTDTEGRFGFVLGAGTSASAPGMAGIAALLNQSEGGAQGNLNPRLYALARKVDNGVFHDITVASSQIVPCSIDLPSPCNNSSPSLDSAEGGANGYMVGDGYDLVTGLGSIDVERLLSDWGAVRGRDACPSPGMPCSLHSRIRHPGAGGR